MLATVQKGLQEMRADGKEMDLEHFLVPDHDTGVGCQKVGQEATGKKIKGFSQILRPLSGYRLLL